MQNILQHKVDSSSICIKCPKNDVGKHKHTNTHATPNALFIYIFIAYGCRKRGAEGAREVAGNHVFEQVGDDHTVWGTGVNDLFIDPSGPS